MAIREDILNQKNMGNDRKRRPSFPNPNGANMEHNFQFLKFTKKWCIVQAKHAKNQKLQYNFNSKKPEMIYTSN
jgi:hypothetical protein